MTIAMVGPSTPAFFISEVARSVSSASIASKKSSTRPISASCSRTTVPSKSLSSMSDSERGLCREDVLRDLRLQGVEPVELLLATDARDEIGAERLVVEIAVEVEEVGLDAQLRSVDGRPHADVHDAGTIAGADRIDAVRRE